MKNLHVVLHDMQCNMSHGLLDLHKAQLKEMGQRQNQETTALDLATLDSL